MLIKGWGFLDVDGRGRRGKEDRSLKVEKGSSLRGVWPQEEACLQVDSAEPEGQV